MPSRFTEEDDALLEELGVAVEPEKKSSRTPREERIIAGFEEIQHFVEKHGRAPQHGENRDIFERLYAVRLDRLRALEECRSLLAPLDRQSLLAGAESAAVASVEPIDEDELLAELSGAAGSSRISAEKRAAEEIANRQKCEDFDRFKPLFEKVQQEIESGVRQTRPFELKAEIRPSSWFIVGGQKAYVAEMGELFANAQGKSDARLRVIFDNGTESNLLMRSLQRALHKDDAGRRITDPSAGPLFAKEDGPLFAGENAEGDLASGTIYVLRSKSDHPFVTARRDVLHKIGVTGGDVAKRIANAELDPTFLMADVEIVATYKLYNINRIKLENLIHRIFDAARPNIEIKD